MFLLIALPSTLIGWYAIKQLTKIATPIETEIPQRIGLLSTDSQWQLMAETIRYYDEVLTQAARNYAFTDNVKWKIIYDEAVPKLDEVIKTVLSRGDVQDKKIFGDIDSANLRLVEMETTAFSLTDSKKSKEAVEILESSEYWQQKEIYKAGLEEFANKRGLQYSQSTVQSIQALNRMTKETDMLISQSLAVISVVMILSFGLALVSGILTVYWLTRPIMKLKKTVREISEGNLDERVEIESKDEIGELGTAFNKMTEKLKQTQEEIEAKIMNRTKELEKVNGYMVGRELKMIELKKKIKDFERKNGS